MDIETSNYETLKDECINYILIFNETEKMFKGLDPDKLREKNCLKNYRDEFQKLIDVFSNLNINMFDIIVKLKDSQTNHTDYTIKNNIIDNCEKYLGVTQVHIQRIQNLYLF